MNWALRGELGLTPDEYVTLARLYKEIAIAAHGAKADAVVRRIDAATRKYQPAGEGPGR